MRGVASAPLPGYLPEAVDGGNTREPAPSLEKFASPHVRDPMLDQLNNWFTHHPPTPEQVAQYESIRNAGRMLATVIVANCPPSADRTTAIRLVREAIMTANASIACGGK